MLGESRVMGVSTLLLPVIGIMSARGRQRRFIRGAALLARSDRSAGSLESAIAATTNVAQAPTQATAQSTWTQRITDFIAARGPSWADAP